jgi:hypothetical protein
MSITKNIRDYCLWCCNGQKKEVVLCPDESCSLWTFRISSISGHPFSSLKAIKARCKDCKPESRDDVKDCEDVKCPLHLYRLGKNPYRKKKIYTDEEKRDIAKRLKEARK